MESNNIVSKVIEICQKFPEKKAIIYQNDQFFFKTHYEKVTYRQLYIDVIDTAKRLKKYGFKQGDRILVFVPMSYELYVIALAILYIGAVLVFVDAWSNKNRLSMACDIVKPVGFIGTLKAQILRLSGAIRKIPIKVISNSLVSNSQEVIDQLRTGTPENVSLENEAIVTFTTGSTGAPKAAKRTHGFLLSQRKALMAHMSLQDNDVDLATLPIFVLNNMSLGVTTVLPNFNPAKPSDFDPKKLLEQINTLNITSSIGSPAFFENLANYLVKTKTPSSFKTIYTGGAPIFKPLAIKLRQAFPKTDVHVVYGATEVEPVSSISLDDYIQQDHSSGLPVGKKVDSLKIKIIKPSNEPIIINDNESIQKYEVSDDEVGEILVSGDHVLKEYIGSPLEFKKNKIVCDGELWHRTGDAGRIDSKGFIYLHGRVKNRFLNVHKKNVFALPIEQELLNIDKIEFSSIFSVKDKLYIALEPENTLSRLEKKNIISMIKDKFKDLNIDEIVFIDKIPRDPRHNSKANYEKLVELYK
ncbi:peptide synthase [Candidatus Magnetomorum sp. HK-1]|nr:peptide synthase [Candidatus Magnetomorum sp. HK-1]